MVVRTKLQRAESLTENEALFAARNLILYFRQTENLDTIATMKEMKATSGKALQTDIFGRPIHEGCFMKYHGCWNTAVQRYS